MMDASKHGGVKGNVMFRNTKLQKYWYDDGSKLEASDNLSNLDKFQFKLHYADDLETTVCPAGSAHSVRIGGGGGGGVHGTITVRPVRFCGDVVRIAYGPCPLSVTKEILTSKNGLASPMTFTASICLISRGRRVQVFR